MVEKKVEVAILGAGTAGMSACREVSKHTDDFVLINGGPYGTTCARVGCMPSKLFIQAANDFHRRHKFEELGIEGSAELRVNGSKVIQRVQSLRDYFVGSVLKSVKELGEKNIEGYAKFEEPGVLKVDNGKIIANKIIIAVGTRPLIPTAWKSEENRIITTDDVFELKSLPKTLTLIGLGAIGLEMGQAMSRLGVRVCAIGSGSNFAMLSDPKLTDYAYQLFEKEFESIEREKMATPEDAEASELILMASGRKPNFDLLDFEKSGVPLNDKGFPDFDPHTMKVVGAENLYIAGDVTGEKQILHEAADEGRIAGFNAVHETDKCFKRRCPMGVVFTDPNLANVGLNYSELEQYDPICSEVSFENQGRSLVMAKNTGLLRLYGDRKTGTILGSEMVAPAAEHFAHLIAWSIQRKATAAEMLSMPYYHPVIEEGLRTAVRSLSEKVELPSPDLETPPCEQLFFFQ